MKNAKNKKPKVRKSWGTLDPATRIVPDATKDYNRAATKKDWLEEIDKELEAEETWEDKFLNNFEF